MMYLGKIVRSEFGHCGYQESFIGLNLDFVFDKSATISDSILGGWYQGNKWTPNCKWTEEGNKLQHSVMAEKISQILLDANCLYISQLLGKPVEITVSGNRLVSWRILTEVI